MIIQSTELVLFLLILGNTKIELMHPYGENSPIKNFLDKHAGGAIHHICIEVSDINQICETLKSKNIRILGDGIPKIGAHNKPVVFLHPKDFLWNTYRIRTGVKNCLIFLLFT